MPHYMRALVPGGTFFFTVTWLSRRRKLLTENLDYLQEGFRAARRRPFTVEAIVIVPHHLHCIWTLPSGDADSSARGHDIKARFAARIPRGERLSARRFQKGERGIWPRRFWEHVIRDAGDYGRQVDYLHYNPGKCGQVMRVAARPYASFYCYVERGIYNFDWAADDNVRGLEME